MGEGTEAVVLTAPYFLVGDFFFGDFFGDFLGDLSAAAMVGGSYQSDHLHMPSLQSQTLRFL